MAAGIYPAFDYMKRPLVDGFKTGLAMPFKACLIHLQGDWAEFCHTLAFMSWSSILHPCLFCFCTQNNWENDGDLSLSHYPWELIDHFMYMALCTACEVKLVLNQAQRRAISKKLFYDKREAGGRGADASAQTCPFFTCAWVSSSTGL